MFNISEIPKHGRNALFIRHSERFHLEQGEFGIGVPLTENGKKTAEQMGKIIREQGYRLNCIFASPTVRTLQTAHHIALGYGGKIDIIPDDILMGKDLYVIDPEQASQTPVKGYELFIRYARGEKFPGWGDINTANRKLDCFLNINSQKGLNIFVSHDYIIAIFMYFKLKKFPSQENWLNFLDGININYDD